MLLELARWLAEYFRAFAVVEYITLRAVLACATALLIGLAAGPRVIRKLTAMKIGQAVRAYGPESHLQKNGTPTMGGVLILIAIAISTLLWADWTNRFVWVVLLVTFGFGWIGWARRHVFAQEVRPASRGGASRRLVFELCRLGPHHDGSLVFVARLGIEWLYHAAAHARGSHRALL